VNTDDDGPGSLRQAILDANRRPGPDTIIFDIPSSDPGCGRKPGVCSIRPLSALPSIDDPALIDGLSQPGSIPSLGPPGAATVSRPGIELDGSAAGPEATGLRLTAGSSTVRGLVIGRFESSGILLEGAGGNTVVGNMIGTDLAASTDAGNGRAGIDISTPNNAVGGPLTGDRNIISGNRGPGVRISGAGAERNRIEGNLIGTDPTGTTAVGNETGVLIGPGRNNAIGGIAPTAQNVIAGNRTDGILLTTAAGLNVVQSNLIGVGVNGALPLGNQRSGIRIEGTENLIGGPSAATRNVISANGRNGVEIVGATATGNRVQNDVIGADAGGTASLGNAGHGVYVDATGPTVIGDVPGGSGAGNTIAFNDGDGVALASGSAAARGVAILGNAIYGNGRLGVDLGDDGVTPNDSRDVDDGPNRLQNYPILTAVVATGSSTTVVGGLASTPNVMFTVQLFANPTCDPSGFGQGRMLVASAQLATDTAGVASLNIPLAAGVRASDWITATATDPQGNTSEFSPCRSATPPPPTATPTAPFFPLG
jgi:hypothetical protein